MIKEVHRKAYSGLNDKYKEIKSNDKKPSNEKPLTISKEILQEVKEYSYLTQLISADTSREK